MSFAVSTSINPSRNYNITSASSEWNRIPHKGMTAMPEADIIQELKELVEKTKIAKSNGDSAELERIDNRKNLLRTQYISYASPDRKALFEQAKRTLNNDQ